MVNGWWTSSIFLTKIFKSTSIQTPHLKFSARLRLPSLAYRSIRVKRTLYAHIIQFFLIIAVCRSLTIGVHFKSLPSSYQPQGGIS